MKRNSLPYMEIPKVEENMLLLYYKILFGLIHRMDPGSRKWDLYMGKTWQKKPHFSVLGVPQSLISLILKG